MLEDFVADLKKSIEAFRHAEISALIACQGGDGRHEHLRGRIIAAQQIEIMVKDLFDTKYNKNHEDDEARAPISRNGIHAPGNRRLGARV